MLVQKLYRQKLWKKKPVCVCTGLFAVFILYCMIRLLMPVREYRYEGSYIFETGNPTENTVLYEGIRLPPGVYRIELEYDAELDMGGVCTVMDGSVFSGGLLSNGEHLYKGLQCTGYEMWLFEGTDSCQVVVSYGGKGNLQTGSLKVVETRGLWTMLLSAGIFFGVIVILVFAFYYYDKEYAVSREKKNVIFFLLLISLVASIPYICGYTITGADLTYHLQRIEGVKDGLLGGQFPVRLEPRWVYDHGYANGIFYCNTFLYFPALLRILGFPVSVSYNLYCIILNMATAGISYYCFHRIFRRQSIGLMCSALYTLSVFRIYKLIITSAAGEGTAVTFIPLVFYGLYRVFAEDPKERGYRTAWIPIMLGYAGLIQSHVLTCEITALVTVCFCAANLRKLFCKDTFLVLFKGAVGAVLVSLWYLVPFLDYYITQDVHIRNVSARTIQSSGLYLAHLLLHFWPAGVHTPSDGNGMQDSHAVGIGMVLVGALILFCILWFSGVFRKSEPRRTFFAKQVALIGVLLLFMSTDSFPWDRIQALHEVAASLVSSLQFPNRFLGWGTVCLVFLFGFCMGHFLEEGEKYSRWLGLAAVFAVSTSGMYLLDSVNSSQEYFELYNEESMGFGYISGAEYLIEGTDQGLLTFAGPTGGAGIEILEYEKKPLGMNLRCVNSGDRESYVDLPLLMYKGYRAADGETGEKLSVSFGDNNVVRVSVPAHFDGEVRAGFESPVYWRISELVTFLSVAGLAVYGVKGYKSRYSSSF